MNNKVKIKAEGLAEDAAEGLPEENPEGTFNILQRDSIEYSREPPEGLHSPLYPLGFSTDCHSF